MVSSRRDLLRRKSSTYIDVWSHGGVGVGNGRAFGAPLARTGRATGACTIAGGEPGERGTRAVVRAQPEGQVRVGAPARVEGVRVGEAHRVAVRRGGRHHQLGARRHRPARRSSRRGWPGAARRAPAGRTGRLLDRAGHRRQPGAAVHRVVTQPQPTSLDSTPRSGRSHQQTGSCCDLASQRGSASHGTARRHPRKLGTWRAFGTPAGPGPGAIVGWLPLLHPTTSFGQRPSPRTFRPGAASPSTAPDNQPLPTHVYVLAQ